jgi:hypothetical protein
MPSFEQDHKQASITLYSVVALNTKPELKNTINRTEAAQALAALLQIDRSTPMSWLRGDFKKHPVSRDIETSPGLNPQKKSSYLRSICMDWTTKKPSSFWIQQTVQVT